MALGFPLIRNRPAQIGTLIILTTVIVTVLGVSLNLTEAAVTSLGRDMTFTYRTEIWQELLDMRTNPVLGVGYDSFWLGERLQTFIRRYQVNEAHNGYLEVYLELGITGVCLLAAMLLSSFRNAIHALRSHFDYGRLRMAVIFLFLIYNVTEAGYKPTTLISFVFLLLSLEVPTEPRALHAATALARHQRATHETSGRPPVTRVAGRPQSSKVVQRAPESAGSGNRSAVGGRGLTSVRSADVTNGTT